MFRWSASIIVALMLAMPAAAQDTAKKDSEEVAALKLDNLKLRVQGRIKDVTAMQLQLQAMQAQAAKIQDDLKAANDDAVRLVGDWYAANGKKRDEWDINLATLEFTKREQPEKKK